MRTCPFHNCGREIPADLFACGKHWYSLSAPDKERIHWAFREWKKGGVTTEELRAIQQTVLGDRGKA